MTHASSTPAPPRPVAAETNAASFVAAVALAAAFLALVTPLASAQEKVASAEVKVGTGIENREIAGGSDSFTVAAGTKLYIWTRVTGATGKVTLAFRKGETDAFKKELDVPSSPYRTNAYKTFRKGDDGDWRAVVSGADGAELGSAAFKVQIGE